MLFVSAGGGSATHLASAVAGTNTGRGAVADFYFDLDGRHDDAWAERYDQAALTEPRWAPKTLCGRDWATMVGGEAGSVGRYGRVALAPDCRRCLSLVDRHFPTPAPDPRLALVVDLTADAVSIFVASRRCMVFRATSRANSADECVSRFAGKRATRVEPMCTTASSMLSAMRSTNSMQTLLVVRLPMLWGRRWLVSLTLSLIRTGYSLGRRGTSTESGRPERMSRN